MARKISIAQKNLIRKLLAHSQIAVSGAVNIDELGALTPQHCTVIENSCLDLIGALREYQRSTKALFMQGQKS